MVTKLRPVFPHVASVPALEDLECDVEGVQWANEARREINWLRVARGKKMRFPKTVFDVAKVQQFPVQKGLGLIHLQIKVPRTDLLHCVS